MTNPFLNRTPPLSGPATDSLLVTPDDVTELPHVALVASEVTGEEVVAYITGAKTQPDYSVEGAV